MLKLHLSLRLVLLCTLFLVTGCGDRLGPRIEVSGTVLLDDRPLPNAKVLFINVDGGVPAEHRTFEAVADANGRYVIPNILPAKYSVAVAEPAPALPPQDPNAPDAVVFAEPVDRLSQYQPGRSPLVVEVAPGMGKADLALKSQP